MATPKNDKSRQQFAALPYKFDNGKLRILLVTSRETKRWVLPKGWPEKDLAPHEAAEREALEEAGVLGLTGDEPLSTFHYYKRLSLAKTKRCVVEVYPLLVLEELEEWPEQHERQREWMTPEEAAKRVEEGGLKKLLLRLKKLPLLISPSSD